MQKNRIYDRGKVEFGVQRNPRSISHFFGYETLFQVKYFDLSQKKIFFFLVFGVDTAPCATYSGGIRNERK